MIDISQTIKDSTFYFTGYLIEQKKEGYGKLTWKNGQVFYKGVFENDGIDGIDIKLHWSNSEIMYEGNYIQGQREGYSR